MKKLYDWKLNGSTFEEELLDTKFEMIGVCRGIVYTPRILGLRYQGFLERPTWVNTEIVPFEGRGAFGSTDGDLEASLALLSSETEKPARLQGILRGSSGESVFYVTGIKVDNQKSCGFEEDTE